MCLKFWCVLIFLIQLFSLAFSFAPRINGGQETKVEAAPFMASLREIHNNKPNHVCGAVIISQKYLLTAARCFYSKEADWFGVAVGTDKKNDQSVLNHAIKRITVQEEYDEFKAPFKHDIALIELEEPLKMNNKIKAIPINTTFFEGQVSAIAFGFGGAYVSSQFKRKKIENRIHYFKFFFIFKDNNVNLQSLQVTTMTNPECRTRVDKLTPVYDFATLCAFSGDKKKRMGHGDAGGPLVHANALIGLSSWNPQVVGSGKPEGFTRIATYIQWIKTHAK